MSSFASADCPQLPVAEPTSDDELQLIFEVESLQTQLSEAGRPVDEKIAQMFIQSVAPKALTVRIRKWQARRDHLLKMVDLPHATSSLPQRIRHYHRIICKKGMIRRPSRRQLWTIRTHSSGQEPA